MPPRRRGYLAAVGAGAAKCSTSASTVRNFVAMLGLDQAVDLLGSTVVASIGPVTAEAAQQLDIATNVMPKRYTIPDLVDALVNVTASIWRSSSMR